MPKPGLSSYRILTQALDWHLGKQVEAQETGRLVRSVNLDRNLVSGAESHAVAPLFHAFAAECLAGVRPYVSRQFRALALRHRLAAEARRKVLERVLADFGQAGIRAVLLKGAALACQVYPHPALRPMRDIDILVPAGDSVLARRVLERIGFRFDASHPSVFMGNMHHLPNATLSFEALTVSLEVHHQVFSRDVQARQEFEQAYESAREIRIYGEVPAFSLDHYSMLNHLCRHGFSQGERVRLIHQYDILAYLVRFQGEIDWARLERTYPFVINTIRCLHYSLYIPPALRENLSLPRARAPNGVGQAMLPYKRILGEIPGLSGIKALFAPPAWWMHVYYRVAPEKSLFWCYLVHHPWKIIRDVTKRVYHGARQTSGLNHGHID